MLAYVRRIERAFLAELDNLKAPIRSSDLLVPDEGRRGRFLAFRIQHAGKIASALAAQNIIVDYRGDSLRVGFGIYHERKDAIRLARALTSVRV
jgi:selenocysteine lyase/cysteine desulfurase